MCGIVGFIGKDKERLATMLSAMAHRGPDGEGMEVNRHFSIGMRRLAIIDPNAGWQPIYSQDRRYCIVFNGEIYNYQDIWKELVALGYKFSTDHSDTEVILHGYEEWGAGVLDRLTGMFAFAVYDAKEATLFIARDRLGIKPLYYYADGPRFIFGSEIKTILTHPDVPRQPDLGVLYEYLLYRVHDAREETFFGGIKRLLPGHYMTVTPDGVESIKQYWKPRTNMEFSSSKSDEAYAQEFYALFKKVIKRHLIADVPVGVCLSGGLDSSGVCCVMRELLDEGTDLHAHGELYTFSALYPNRSIDESQYIRLVEERIASKPAYAYPDVDAFWNELDAWMDTQEEPTISSAPYAYYNVYREASKHVKVILSGNGGDELLAGYLPYIRTYFQSALAQRQYGAAARELVLGFDLYKGFLAEKLKPSPNNLRMGELLGSVLSENSKQYSYEISGNLNERLLQDVTKYSTPNLLRYEDKNSMAFSLESRVPFLDHELVEYIFSLPIDQKIKRGWTRYVYREAMKGHMPEAIRTRRSKIGFTNPELPWMREKSHEIGQIFASQEFASRGLFDAAKVQDAFQRWLGGSSKGDGLVFWRILATELWLRRFMS